MKEHMRNLNKGWQCPKCQKTYAPWIPECTYCLPVVSVPYTWSSANCKCGTTVICPLHNGTWTVTNMEYKTTYGENG